MALIVFAITLFVSAFLLFLVQPMIGKMILPKLGGTPQVWNTCMLFFQTVLLAGYFYTHATTTFLRPRKQMLIHGALLFLPLIVMLAMGRPFDVTAWRPPSGSNPIFATLLLLLTVVGVPFFVVSTSAPLLQKWFSHSGDPAANDPYFLYGASNFGSMLSLAAYPFFVEPWFTVPTQTWIWFVCYIGLMILFFGSAALVWKQTEHLPAESGAKPAPAAPAAEAIVAPSAPASTAIQPSKAIGKKKGLKGVPATSSTTSPSVSRRIGSYDPQTAPMTVLRCVRWALLAAVPSSLMLGVTSYISTDLSPFPLVWAVPLALYLLTFILVFAKWPMEWTKEPHTFVLFLMPLIAVPSFCWVLFYRNFAPTGLHVVVSFLSIFIITLAMHGELAKDRPTARNLTLFFLLMSFGGMLGGLFNAMIAPVIFNGIWEYPLAIILACFLHPNLMDRGFTDGKILEAMPDLDKSFSEASDNAARTFGRKPEGQPFLFVYFWDIVVGILIAIVAWYTTTHRADMGRYIINIFTFLGGSEESWRRWPQVYQIGAYGLPILLCILCSARSLRYAIGIAGLLFFGYFVTDRDKNLLFAGRSYFGVLKVFRNDKEDPRPDDFARDPRTGQALFVEADDIPKDMFIPPYHYLMHGSTYHGRNYQIDELARLATTYYHRFGPIGVVMERYNWFPGKQNTYFADNRMPASMVALAASGLGANILPLEMLSNVWSEPPFATVGLGTGTMASYGRPFQHVAYYEIDNLIRDMSRPVNPKDDPFFRYVRDAGDRGSFVEIIMGDARLSLENEKEREAERIAKGLPGPTAMRDNYYSVIELDAFSSDAIPVHLITEEAIKLYMQKLTPDGVLSVHTSNRHLALIEPVSDIAQALKLDWIVGHDPGGDRTSNPGRNKEDRVYSLGHFSSEYIMLARKGVLDKDKLKTAIRGYPANMKTSIINWYKNPAPNRPVWTDNYQNIVSIMR